MKNLNNKGYMLVEIILAFVIAMGVTYFMFELIIKLKNKNDDLIVKTLVSTDQAIIYNTIMKNLDNGFDCNKIVIDGNKFKYDGNFIIEVSEFAVIGYDSNNVDNCKINGDEVNVNISINVKQLKDNFDINIKYVKNDSGSDESPLLPPNLPSSSSSSLLPIIPSSGSSSSNSTKQCNCSTTYPKEFVVNDVCYCCRLGTLQPSSDSCLTVSSS